MAQGKLYICATPIGNLKDITLRALEVLASCNIILCEDTRVSKRLLKEYNIQDKKLIAFHEHNEKEIIDKVISWLIDGLTIVQVTDAGTPGISDPGVRLCNKAFECGYSPIPLPGACAYLSLLSVAGVDHKSLFYGFLPPNSLKRTQLLSSWKNIDHAVIIYESPHRIVECLKDIESTLGSERIIVMGRELTKQFETIKKLKIQELIELVTKDPNQQKGEFALLICPQKVSASESSKTLTDEQIKVLELLSQELPPKKVTGLCHKICGGDKELLYDYLIKNCKRKA